MSTRPAAHLQYLKPQLLAQALVHHKFVFTLPKRVRNNPEDLQGMVTKANSIKGFWYVECDIISPKHLRESALIQLPVVRGNIPSTDHKDIVRDLFSNIFNSPATLADIGISEQRKELAMQAIAQVWTTGTCSVAQTPEVIKLRQQGEEQKALERARELVERAVKDLKNKMASENEEVRQIYKQITPTFTLLRPRRRRHLVRDRLAGRRSCTQRSCNEKSALQTILAEGRRQRVARPLGKGLQEVEKIRFVTQ